MAAPADPSGSAASERGLDDIRHGPSAKAFGVRCTGTGLVPPVPPLGQAQIYCDCTDTMLGYDRRHETECRPPIQRHPDRAGFDRGCLAPRQARRRRPVVRAPAADQSRRAALHRRRPDHWRHHRGVAQGRSRISKRRARWTWKPGRRCARTVFFGSLRYRSRSPGSPS